jgi:HAD superfamily hydrolase (TIGR01509 family)
MVPDMRGIIFDMDGVLCDSEPFILEAAQAMFRTRYGKEVPGADFHQFVGTGEDRYLGGTAALHGIPIRLPEDKIETYRLYLELIKGRLPPLPGVLDTVREARRCGIKLAVASAADLMKVSGNLEAIGLGASAFDTVVTGSDVERKKPHPDGFLLAAKRLGLPPGECLVVEDALNGIQAAVAAGCFRLGLTTSFTADRLAAAGAQWTAPHLGGMPDELRARLFA